METAHTERRPAATWWPDCLRDSAANKAGDSVAQAFVIHVARAVQQCGPPPHPNGSVQGLPVGSVAPAPHLPPPHVGSLSVPLLLLRLSSLLVAAFTGGNDST